MNRPIPTGLWMADASRFESARERTDEHRSSERVGLAGIAFATLRGSLGCRWAHAWLLVTDQELAEAADEYELRAPLVTGAIVNLPYPFPREHPEPAC